MKIFLFLLASIIIYSCSSERERGQITSKNNEYTAIYTIAQNKIIEQYKLHHSNLNYSNFENFDSRDANIYKTETGYKIKSWFNQIKDNGDTLITNFSCNVILDQDNIDYVITDLECHNPKELNKGTVSINLRYFGFMCPCAQWISEKNELIFDSLAENNLPYGDSLFYYIIPSSDSIKYPIQFTDSLGISIRYKFTGNFYKERQFMNWEGEMGSEITFQYDKIEVIK